MMLDAPDLSLASASASEGTKRRTGLAPTGGYRSGQPNDSRALRYGQRHVRFVDGVRVTIVENRGISGDNEVVWGCGAVGSGREF